MLSPVEQRRSRARASPSGNPEDSGPSGFRRDRGLSSPAEMRKGGHGHGPKPVVHHHPPAFFSSIPQSPMLQQHAQFSRGDSRARAASPEPLARRGLGALNERPVLRREKTAVFDNRYPSLDMRSEKRKSLYELQEEAAARVAIAADLRRRSYHELSNPELLHPMGAPMPPHMGVQPHHFNPHHNFQHSGKKLTSKDAKKQQKQQQQQMAAAHAAAAAAMSGVAAPPMMHPGIPPWAAAPGAPGGPPGGYPPPSPMGPPSLHGAPAPPPMGHPPHPAAAGRFGMPPQMRPY